MASVLRGSCGLCRANVRAGIAILVVALAILCGSSHNAGDRCSTPSQCRPGGEADKAIRQDVCGAGEAAAALLQVEGYKVRKGAAFRDPEAANRSQPRRLATPLEQYSEPLQRSASPVLEAKVEQLEAQAGDSGMAELHAPDQSDLTALLAMATGLWRGAGGRGGHGRNSINWAEAPTPHRDGRGLLLEATRLAREAALALRSPTKLDEPVLGGAKDGLVAPEALQALRRRPLALSTDDALLGGPSAALNMVAGPLGSAADAASLLQQGSAVAAQSPLPMALPLERTDEEDVVDASSWAFEEPSPSEQGGDLALAEQPTRKAPTQRAGRWSREPGFMDDAADQPYAAPAFEQEDAEPLTADTAATADAPGTADADAEAPETPARAASTAAGAAPSTTEAAADDAAKDAVAAVTTEAPAAAGGLSPEEDEEVKLASARLQGNAVSDGTVMWVAVASSGIVTLLCFMAVAVMRHRHPVVYEHNAMVGQAPFSPPRTSLGWITASWAINLDDVAETVGLDNAMLLEFTHLSMRLMVFIGVPMACVMGPLHAHKGGDRWSGDFLGKLGLFNVVDGSWLFQVHALLVWYVVLVTQKLFYDSMRAFTIRRHVWLREMPAPRSCTVLVEGIPEAHRSDAALADYFRGVLGRDAVEKAYVVRQSKALLALKQELEGYEQSLKEAMFLWEQSNRASGAEASARENVSENIRYLERRKLELDERVNAERDRINELVAHDDHSVFSSSGFVTFKQRHHAEMAISSRFSATSDQFLVSASPDPSDVIFEDLAVEDQAGADRSEQWGCLLLFLLVVALVPVVVAVSGVAKLQTVGGFVHSIGEWAGDRRWTMPAWNALLGPTLLNLIMSFVPTLLSMVFYRLFLLKSEAWLQRRLQSWYFYVGTFLLVPVTLVGAVAVQCSKELLPQPLDVLELLVSSLPLVAHFYLFYVTFQCSAHAVNLLRYSIYYKFVSCKDLCGEERARELAEPEDQDYFGIGSRSARFAMILVISLAFCNMVPLLPVFAFVHFALCRIVYGYLVVFAETRKPDLGGAFFPDQIRHVQEGLVLYTVMMTCILWQRSPTKHPAVFAGCALIFQGAAYFLGASAFSWQSLTVEEARSDDGTSKREPSRTSYEQPELVDERQRGKGKGKGKGSGSSMFACF